MASAASIYAVAGCFPSGFGQGRPAGVLFFASTNKSIYAFGFLAYKAKTEPFVASPQGRQKIAHRFIGGDTGERRDESRQGRKKRPLKSW
jgi:hypothetical protein